VRARVRVRGRVRGSRLALDRGEAPRQHAVSPLYLPYTSPISPLYLAWLSTEANCPVSTLSSAGVGGGFDAWLPLPLLLPLPPLLLPLVLVVVVVVLLLLLLVLLLVVPLRTSWYLCQASE
jgi:hypothetical protein